MVPNPQNNINNKKIMNKNINSEKQITHKINFIGNPYVITAASKSELDLIRISFDAFLIAYGHLHGVQHLEEVTFNEGVSSFFEENVLRPLLFNFIDLLGNHIQNIAQFKKDVMAYIEKQKCDFDRFVDFHLMMYKLYSLNDANGQVGENEQ